MSWQQMVLAAQYFVSAAALGFVSGWALLGTYVPDPAPNPSSLHAQLHPCATTALARIACHEWHHDLLHRDWVVDPLTDQAPTHPRSTLHSCLKQLLADMADSKKVSPVSKAALASKAIAASNNNCISLSRQPLRRQQPHHVAGCGLPQ